MHKNAVKAIIKPYMHTWRYYLCKEKIWMRIDDEKEKKITIWNTCSCISECQNNFMHFEWLHGSSGKSQKITESTKGFHSIITKMNNQNRRMNVECGGGTQRDIIARWAGEKYAFRRAVFIRVNRKLGSNICTQYLVCKSFI